MEKIAIIGSPGAGKSTFAKAWSRSLRTKVYHLDRIFWKPGWKPIDKEARIDILQKLVQEKQWIIEGSNLSASESRLVAADIIIFLDISPILCLWRIIKRHIDFHGRSRRDIPEGCVDKLTLLLILKVLFMLKVLFFPLPGRIKLEKNLHTFPPEKVIRLHSTKEIEGFLAQLEPYVHKSRQSVQTRSALEQSFNIISSCFPRGFYLF